MDCSLSSSSIHGIFQARILERVPFPTPGGLPNPGINPCLLHALPWQADSLPLGHLGSPITIALLYGKELRSLNFPFFHELQQTQNDFLNEILALVTCPFSVLFSQNWKWPSILAGVLLLIEWFNYHERELIFSRA